MHQKEKLRVSVLRPIAVAFAAASLGSCSLETFEILPCSSRGNVAFSIQPIEGWFSDYQPRPAEVQVSATEDGPGSGYPGVWRSEWRAETDYGHLGPRPPQQLIIYGRELKGWRIVKAPEPLRPGLSYRVSMEDGGHYGSADFIAGGRLPTC